jgi:hypothetical protein
MNGNYVIRYNRTKVNVADVYLYNSIVLYMIRNNEDQSLLRIIDNTFIGKMKSYNCCVIKLTFQNEIFLDQ